MFKVKKLLVEDVYNIRGYRFQLLLIKLRSVRLEEKRKQKENTFLYRSDQYHLYQTQSSTFTSRIPVQEKC